MRNIPFAIVTLAGISWFLACNPQPRTVFYSHGLGFRIAVPSGWTKTMENDRLFIFCCDNRRTIEAGGYRYELSPSELARLSGPASDSLVLKFIQDQLAVFTEENAVRELSADPAEKTTWAGHPAYYIQARGRSVALSQNVIVEIRMLLHKENATIYFLDLLMPAQDYAENGPMIRNVAGSFQVLD
jgi:hypothetical protein